MRYVGLVLVPVWRAGCARPAGRWITGVPSFMKRPEVQPEPVFVNVYGAQESIPRNEFRQRAGR
jgi:hypothetical protein